MYITVPLHVCVFVKVVRAKERIEMELDEKVCPDPTPTDSPTKQDSDSEHKS